MAATVHPGPTLAEVLAAACAAPEKLPALSPAQWRVIHTLQVCRTPALGGHQYRCQCCGTEHFVPHSCGNRHCPQCQGPAAARWLEAQEALLLPIPYFHLVFTLPHGLNPLIRQNRRVLYTLLFEAASQTLLTFGRNRFGPEVQLGVTAILHTWGQTLIDHYHVHCLVTGGAGTRVERFGSPARPATSSRCAPSPRSCAPSSWPDCSDSTKGESSTSTVS